MNLTLLIHVFLSDSKFDFSEMKLEINVPEHFNVQIKPKRPFVCPVFNVDLIKDGDNLYERELIRLSGIKGQFRTVNKDTYNPNIRLKMINLTNDDVHRIKEDYNRNKEYNLFTTDYSQMAHVENTLSNFFKWLLEISPNKFEVLNTLGEMDDSDPLNNYKEILLSEQDNSLQDLRIIQLSIILQRFFYELGFLSQNEINNKKVMYTNLGLNNVVLMVSGGNNTSKTSNSRRFKLIYPAYSKEFCSVRSETINFNNMTFLQTPWMVVNEKMLHDYSFLYYKTLNFMMTMKNRLNVGEENILVWPFIIALNGRKRVEAALHNMRYITANSSAERTKIQDLLPSLKLQPECMLSSFINFKISNLSEYISNLRAFINDEKEGYFSLFTNVYCTSIDSVSIEIYSTYLAKKGGYNQTIEQGINTKSVLSDLKDVGTEKNIQIKNRLNVEGIEHLNDVYDNDLTFDSDFSYMVGATITSNLINKGVHAIISRKWEEILDENIFASANNMGLRGYNQETLYNSKGYEVMYSFILKHFEMPHDFFENLITDEEKNTELSKYNISYRQILEEFKPACWNFHMVDKEQRGGSREIYVMDVLTKLFQQPIEKLFGFMCNHIDNEIISLPSSLRLQKIHKEHFDKTSFAENSCYWVLDCRKWAPHSNTEKYIDMIEGMTQVLPLGFVRLAKMFMSKMKDKKVWLSDHNFKQLKKEKYVHLDLIKEGKSIDYEYKGTEISNPANYHYFNLPYSFMMGMFNYMSSIYHAGAQLYIGDLIFKTCNINNGVGVLKMNAHSDDSAGLFEHSSNICPFKCFKIYEFFLKMGNMMISLKKSGIFKNYFEFLSILYIKNQLVTMVPKFCTNVAIRVTGMGYIRDMESVISKSIELMTYGGTFSEAYQLLCLQRSALLYFYHMNTKFRFSKPLSLLGIPDCHPMLYLLCGTEADYVRLSYSPNNLEVIRVLKYLTSGTGKIKFSPEKEYRLNYNRMTRLLILPQLNDEFNWTLRHVTCNNTLFSIRSFQEKVKENDFSMAIAGDNPTIRFSRAYKHVFQRSYKIENMRLTLREFDALIELCFQRRETLDQLNDIDLKLMEIDENQDAFTFFSLQKKKEKLEDLNSLLDKIELEEKDWQVCEPNFLVSDTINFINNFKSDNKIELMEKRYTPKPVTIYKPSKEINFKFVSTNEEIVSKMFNMPLHWVWSKSFIVDEEVSIVRNMVVERNLPMTPDSVLEFLNKINPKKSTKLYIYAHVSSQSRYFENYYDYLTLLSQNSLLKYDLTVRVKILNDVRLSSFEFHKKTQLYYTLGMLNPNVRDKIAINWNKKIINYSSALNVIPELEYGMMLGFNRYGYTWISEQSYDHGKWLGLGVLFITMPQMDIYLYINDDIIFHAKICQRNKFLSDFSGEYFENVLLKHKLKFSRERKHNNLGGHFLKNSRTKIWELSNHYDYTDIIPIEELDKCEVINIKSTTMPSKIIAEVDKMRRVFNCSIGFEYLDVNYAKEFLDNDHNQIYFGNFTSIMNAALPQEKIWGLKLFIKKQKLAKNYLNSFTNYMIDDQFHEDGDYVSLLLRFKQKNPDFGLKLEYTDLGVIKYYDISLESLPIKIRDNC